MLRVREDTLRRGFAAESTEFTEEKLSYFYFSWFAYEIRQIALLL
jgi:hypothetical protein